VCEGAVTEPKYIDGFRIAHGANTVRVHVKAPGGDPKATVETAIKLTDEAADRARRERDDNLRYDEVWCVFDVDEHPRLDEARRTADASGVLLAISNPCFELWLLLHFADQTAALSRKRASELLTKHLPGYAKHVRFEEMAAGYSDAARRAASLDSRHLQADTQGGNPSSGVYCLTERIQEFGRRQRLRQR
ncbi:MAG TPA: RloB family protein, partial [Longimicrobium sp.]|nr:RloB family protein [Longimicrobium sp.]